MQRENLLLHQLLGVSGSLQEHLHYGCEELHLDLGVLIVEIVKEIFKEIISIVNPLCILSNDPDHAGLAFWIIKVVLVLTQSRNNGLIIVGILSEDDHHCLLHHIVGLGLNEIQQGGNTSLQHSAPVS
jgi:hypothetical protein